MDHLAVPNAIFCAVPKCAKKVCHQRTSIC